jgi:hypothetical protein
VAHEAITKRACGPQGHDEDGPVAHEATTEVGAWLVGRRWGAASGAGGVLGGAGGGEAGALGGFEELLVVADEGG